MRKQSSAWKKIGREKMIWSTLLFGCSVAVALLFQNCTQPVTGTDSSSAAAAQSDFAYDTTVDQIAYMSCSNMTAGAYDSSAYFTLRAGAYRTGGIELTNAFRAIHPNSTAAYLSTLLQESASNNTTTLQLAVRPINSFQNILTQNSGSATLHEDYDNLFTNLGERGVSDVLSQTAAGTKVRYMRDGSIMGSRVEGSVRFNSSYAMMSAIRTDLTNGDYLALTYSNNNSAGSGATLARSPADISLYSTSKIDANKVIYGHGFAMSFGQPTVNGIYGNFPQQVMRSVTEYNLANISDRTVTGTWTCPTTMQFRVVQRLDLSKPAANCILKPDPPTLTSAMAIVRQSLRTEDWYLDMDHNCIIPKKSTTGCYGDSTTVNYNLTTACDPNNTASLCTSYASICTRN